MASPTRTQKRWSSRLRTAGALLSLVGAVALIDRVLPGSRQAWGTLPAGAQIVLGAGGIAIGIVLSRLGKRWH